MNQDFSGNSYPPPNFLPVGPVILNPNGEGVPPDITVDAQPTQGSGNPVSSNGVFVALTAKEPTLSAQGSPQAQDFVYVGNKSWRNLPDWIQSLIDAAINNTLDTLDWSEIDGMPDFLLEEADPTVPAWVKSITQEQKDALEWFRGKFPRTAITPGDVFVVGLDGDSVSTKPLGELLTKYFPALSTIMSGVVSAPISVSAVQVISDVKVSWTDIERRAGYYGVEVRFLNIDGEYSSWEFLNQPENDVLEHIVPSANLPANITRVGVRIRYIDTQNVASAWTETEIAYSSTPVVGETTYTILLQEGRWYGDLQSETFSILLEEGRWYGDVAPDATTGIGGGGSVGDAEDYTIVLYEHEYNSHLELELYNKPDGTLWMRDIGTVSMQTDHYFLNNHADLDDCTVFDEPVIIGKLYHLIKYSIDSYNYERWRTGQDNYPAPNTAEWRDCEQTELWFSIEPLTNQA